MAAQVQISFKKLTLKLRATDYNTIFFLLCHNANKISCELEIKSAAEVACSH